MRRSTFSSRDKTGCQVQETEARTGGARANTYDRDLASREAQEVVRTRAADRLRSAVGHRRL